MSIIDTHAHVEQLQDLEGSLQRAEQAGVSDIMAMSVDLASMRKTLKLAAKYTKPKIHTALGIHPGMIKPQEQAEAFAFMETNIGQATAVGETGLDYWYKWVRKDQAERAKQKDSFQFHVDIARRHDLPIVIHSRGAWADCLEMARSAGIKRALFHWYSGPVDVLQAILDCGYYVSTSPSVGYSPQSREAMSYAPLERILIETDSPVRYKDGDTEYLSEPKDVIRTLQALAVLKNTEGPVVLAQVNQNARDFFKL